MNKVVLFGPPLSGKTTLLRAFASAHEVAMVTRSGGDHPTAPVLLVVHANCGGVETELVTIPGIPWETSDWEPLLREVNALVAVFDLQRSREGEMKAARAQLEPFLTGRTHVAVLTKADLGSHCFDSVEAIEKYRLDGWRVFVSTAAAPAIEFCV